MSQGVNDLVNYLIQRLPSQCALVIESRAVPNLDLTLLFARDEILSFNATFLHFTNQEIYDLAHLQGMTQFTEREAEQLNTIFNGWIAGILLGTRLGDRHILRSGRDVYVSERAPDVQIDRQNLFAYLVNVVFEHDHENYTFLKETAILPQITPALCNAMLESNNAAERLLYLELQGLFVIRSNSDSQLTYICHPVLREMLCDDLRRWSLERFIMLHRRAMEYWRTVGDFEQAIQHAIEANMHDEVAHLILQAYKPLLEHMRLETLTRWIDALPFGTIMKYPELLLVQANTYLRLSKYIQALPILTMASEVLKQQPSLVDEDERPLLQAAISIASSEALFEVGEYRKAQQLCLELIEQVAADEVALHAEAHTLLGVCSNVQGNYNLGIAHLQKALLLWGRDSERAQTAKLHNTLARTYGLIGNYALAEHHLSRAAKCWDRLQDNWGKVNNLLNMGMIKQRQGEYGYAEACFKQALTMARNLVYFRRGEAYALANLGDLYLIQGNYHQALASTEDGLTIARHLEDRYLINCTLCTLAMTYLYMGDSETAMFLLSEACSVSKNSGHEKVNRELTRCMILLHQQKYDEAGICLVELKEYLQDIGLPWELLCATLRLGECLLLQKRPAEAVQHINEVAPIILGNDYEQTVLNELSHLPSLERAIRTMPELANLRSILQSETQAEEQQEELSSELSGVAGDLTVLENARLKIFALGEPSIVVDEKAITHWRRPRAMELFFLLLDSGHPLRKEQIITALWPDVDEHISQTLHSTIHYLRKSMGEACIASRSGTYWLDLNALYGHRVWYDVAAFQQHIVKAKAALNAGDDVTAQAEFLAAVDLYQGDYVQSFYSDWCMFQRDKLRLFYIDARQQLALITWRHEQFDECVNQWQHVLAIDDCIEDAHYGLMRCYIRRGQRGLALRQYQRCAEILQRELGIEPGTTMQNLFQSLLKNPTSKQV
jgi:LuxR family maltose regulon positive regulatory protein